MSSQSDVFIVDFIFEYLKKTYTDIVLLVAKEDEKRTTETNDTQQSRSSPFHSLYSERKKDVRSEKVRSRDDYRGDH